MALIIFIVFDCFSIIETNLVIFDFYQCASLPEWPCHFFCYGRMDNPFLDIASVFLIFC